MTVASYLQILICSMYVFVLCLGFAIHVHDTYISWCLFTFMYMHIFLSIRSICLYMYIRRSTHIVLHQKCKLDWLCKTRAHLASVSSQIWIAATWTGPQTIGKLYITLYNYRLRIGFIVVLSIVKWVKLNQCNVNPGLINP